MKIAVYNQQGKEAGEMTLPKEIFDVKMNADLVHQVVVSMAANKRQGSAHTKNRSEVRGGGRKPWRQKGTGRARHGSTRSPIWVGGGVSGGPRNERNFIREIPKKMRRKALFMVLSQKAKQNLLVVLDALELSAPKTNIIAKAIKNLPGANESRLITAPNNGKNIFLAARNMKKTGVAEARNLNAADVLNYKYLIISKDGIKDIETTFANKEINDKK